MQYRGITLNLTKAVKQFAAYRVKLFQFDQHLTQIARDRAKSLNKRNKTYLTFSTLDFPKEGHFLVIYDHLKVSKQRTRHWKTFTFNGRQRGRVVLRALDLKSGGPWFKSSTLLLSGFVLGSPEFNSSTALCK